MTTLTEALGNPAKLASTAEEVKRELADTALKIALLEEPAMKSPRDMLL
jgi:hypothetical protein